MKRLFDLYSYNYTTLSETKYTTLSDQSSIVVSTSIVDSTSIEDTTTTTTSNKDIKNFITQNHSHILHLLLPKIKKLYLENTQSVSTLLLLLDVWILLGYCDTGIVKRLVEVLKSSVVKEVVVEFVLGMLSRVDIGMLEGDRREVSGVVLNLLDRFSTKTTKDSSTKTSTTKGTSTRNKKVITLAITVLEKVGIHGWEHVDVLVKVRGLRVLSGFVDRIITGTTRYTRSTSNNDTTSMDIDTTKDSDSMDIDTTKDTSDSMDIDTITKEDKIKLRKLGLKLSPLLSSRDPKDTLDRVVVVRLVSRLCSTLVSRVLLLLNGINTTNGVSSIGSIGMNSIGTTGTKTKTSTRKRIDDFDFDQMFQGFELLESITKTSMDTSTMDSSKTSDTTKNTSNTSDTSTIDAMEWTIVIHQLVYCLLDPDEFSVRAAALNALTNTANVVSSISGITSAMNTDTTTVGSSVSGSIINTGTMNDTSTRMDVDGTKTNTTINTPSSRVDLITHVLYPLLKKQIPKCPQVCFSDFIHLYGHLVRLGYFSDLKGLLGVDDETSFFMNVVHLQTHRRVRAFKTLSSVASNSILDSTNGIATNGTTSKDDSTKDTTTISNQNIKILIDICARTIFTTTTDHNIVNESLLALTTLVKIYVRKNNWSGYFNTLRRFLNSVKRMGTKGIRVLIGVLDVFDFDMDNDTNDTSTTNVVSSTSRVSAVGGSGVGTNTVDSKVDTENEDTEMVEEDEMVEEEDNEEVDMVVIQEKKELAVRVHTAVTEKLLPALQRLISVEDDEQVPIRTPLAIAVTKLLKQLPHSSMSVHLPKLLLTLSNVLSSHLQSTRDSARTTLVTIAGMLGPAYLHYVLKSLKTALKRGYQLHVLGFTVHAILEEIVKQFQVTSIDDCIDTIVGICVHDIFGETGKEREVQELKNKMREIRSSKSFETLEFLARLVSFGSVYQMIQPIKDIMYQTNQVDTIRKVEEVFKRLSAGLNANEDVQDVPFMVFCQKLLSESLPLAQPDKHTSRKLTDQEKHIKVELKRDAVFTVNYYEANVHLFIEFGLSLLLTSLKRERIHPRDKQHLSMMDPLVPLLGKGLYAKHVNITILSLRVLAVIIKWPLPELVESYPVIVKRCFQLIAKSGTTDSELVQTVFKLLAIIVRDLPSIDVSEKQLVALMGMLGADIEEPDKQTTTFSLIRAILTRQLVCSEVYDLMDKVAQVLVTNQTNQVRELCRHAFIQFLVDYPHGHVRFRKLMTYLVSNLQYEFESGRQSVLELFYLSVTKFSNEMFQEYTDMLVLALVTTLANDESSKCKEMASVLLKMIFKRLDVHRMEKPILMIDKWFGSKVELRQVACQTAGIVIETFEHHAKAWCVSWLDGLFDGVKSCHDQWQALLPGDDENELGWEYGYMALKTMLKLSRHFIDILVFSPKAQDLLTMVVQLQTHPHQWIRHTSAQLLGALYSHTDSSSRCYTGSLLTTHEITLCPILETEDMIRKNAKKCTDMIDSDLLTPEISKQVLKNLLFLGKCLVPFMSEASTLDEDEEDLEEENGVVGVTENDPSSNNNSRHSSSLYWICRRLAFLARQDATKRPKQTIQRQSVFTFFSALYKHVPIQYSSHFLNLFLKTFLICQADPNIQKDQTCKEVLTNAINKLQELVGTTDFLKVYNVVNSEIQERKYKRHEERKVKAVVEPERVAKEKIKRNKNKVEQRKRKALDHDHRRLKKIVRDRHTSEQSQKRDSLLD